MITERIETLLVGNSTGLVNTFKEGGSAADAFAAKGTTTGNMMSKLGLQGEVTGAMLGQGLAAGAVLAGAAVAKFALDGVQKFSDMTGEVRGLRLVMGGTAEDASRVAGAARALGLDVGTLDTGFFQLSKRIAANKDTLAQNNIEVARNSDGSVNMAKTLLNVSDGYKAIVDPALRNLFVMQNFGKSGAAMIPLLTQGREKLAEFYAETAKHGEIFSESDLEKGRQYKLAMQSLDDAWAGLQARLGEELTPEITQFARGLETVAGWMPTIIQYTKDYYDILGKATGVSFLVSGLEELGIVSHDTSTTVGVDLGNIQEKFAGLDAAGAAKGFAALNAEAAKSPKSVGAANQALIDFATIAEADVGIASQVVEGLKAQGVNTTIYDRILHNVADRKYKDVQATQAQKDATTVLTGTYEQQIKVLDDLQNAELAKFDKDIAAQQATWAAKDAADAYNKTLTDGTSSTEDQSKALLTAQDSALKAAAAEGAKAEADHQGEGSAAAHAAGTYAEIASLSSLRDTLDPASPLRVAIQQYIDKLADPAINGVHAATVQVAGLAEAAWSVDQLLAKMRELAGTPWVVSVGITAEAPPNNPFAIKP